jgi:DNA-binding transcriptional ArsR family regulator
MPHEAQVNAAVVAFALMADPTRLRVMWALGQCELDVATLAGLAGTSATGASQHLAKLRLAGLVATRRDGRRVLYRAQDGHVRVLLAQALSHADHQVGPTAYHD